MPGGNGEHAGSFVQCVSADSKNKDAAFLYSLWDTSPSISLQRVMLPYTLRDPYRISHYKSKAYRTLWPAAKEYLIALDEAANHAVIDMIMSGAGDYANAIDRAMTAMYAGKDIKSRLDARRQGVGLDHEEARRGQPAEGSYAQLPEAARRDVEQHGRQAGAGGTRHVAAPR